MTDLPKRLLAAALFFVGCRAQAAPAIPAAALTAPARFASLGLPSALTRERLQGLLQAFVNTGYGHVFRHLGDERDFDHGHLLLDARTKAPIAILYHTQELANEAPGTDYGYLDEQGRNWIQWLDGRGIENARGYERAAYPRTATWDWFVERELPKLRSRYTITDKMLDPERIGAELSESKQWTFTRVDCGAPAADAASNVIRVALPAQSQPVCLALGS